MLLTELKVRKSVIKEKAYKLKDGEGLYLFIHPNGSKYWRLRYTYLGKDNILAIGKYPDVSLSEARAEKANAKKQIAAGNKPLITKRINVAASARLRENSFSAVAKEWHETNKRKWVSGHADDIIKRLENHIFPNIGNKDISAIKPIELLTEIRSIEEKGKNETAHRVLQLCSAVFRYGIITEKCIYNPAQDLSEALKPVVQSHMATISPAELKDFLKAFNKANLSVRTRIAISLLLLFFIRPGELRFCKKEYFDVKKKVLRLPAGAMKMKREHLVPLSAQAIKLLNQLDDINNGVRGYLFPSDPGKKCPVMSDATINKALRTLDFERNVVGHGFRSLASTVLNEKGFPPDVIERQLAHREKNKTRAAYNRAEYMKERTAMMQWWADHLEKAGLVCDVL